MGRRFLRAKKDGGPPANWTWTSSVGWLPSAHENSLFKHFPRGFDASIAMVQDKGLFVNRQAEITHKEICTFAGVLPAYDILRRVHRD